MRIEPPHTPRSGAYHYVGVHSIVFHRKYAGSYIIPTLIRSFVPSIKPFHCSLSMSFSFLSLGSIGLALHAFFTESNRLARRLPQALPPPASDSYNFHTSIRVVLLCFLWLVWNFFWAFHTSWTTKWPIAYMFLILLFCDSVILWPFCVCNANVSSFLCLNIFQSVEI